MMSLTFEQALKRLAEKEPERFVWMKTSDGAIELFCQIVPQEGDHPDYPALASFWEGGTINVTQDDIDEILALIGYSYEVKPQRLWSGKGNHLSWIGVPIKLSSLKSDFGTIPFSDKLSAAKAALIEIVEREYP